MALIWKVPGRARRRKLAAPCEHERAGMGDLGAVGALVIGAARGAPRGALYRQGMRGMGSPAGDAARAFLNRVTGGAVGTVEQKLGRVETALKISTGAALLAAAASLFAATRR